MDCCAESDTSADGLALFCVSCFDDGGDGLADTWDGAVTIESTDLVVSLSLLPVAVAPRSACGSLFLLLLLLLLLLVLVTVCCSFSCGGGVRSVELVVAPGCDSWSSRCTHSGCSLRLLCRDDIHGGLAWVKRLCLLLANTSCIGGI